MWLLLLLLSLTHLYTHTENIENCLNYSDIFDKIRIFSLYLLFRLTCCVLSMMNYSASISIFRVVFINFSVFGNSFDWYTHQPLIRALSVQTLHVFIKLLVLWFRNGLQLEFNKKFSEMWNMVWFQVRTRCRFRIFWKIERIWESKKSVKIIRYSFVWIHTFIFSHHL